MKKIALLIVTIFIFSCKTEKCDNLPKTFSNYKEAVTKISNTSFEYSKDLDTSSSSWIKNASYYSCDKLKGYLIIETKSKKYLHQGVPFQIWEEFRKSSSFGTFYNKNIKTKYQLKLV